MNMKKVKFTQMKEGTKEDYLLLEKHEKKFIEILFQTRIKFKAKLLSSQDKVSRSQQS